MGIEQILPLLQLGMSGAQSAVNTGLGLIPLGISLWDRYTARTDPVMRELQGIVNQRYNNSVTGNPFGNVNELMGGISPGELQVQTIQNLLQGGNPAVSAIQNYQQLAQSQRPGVADSTAGLGALLGRPSPFAGGYQQPTFTPQSPDFGALFDVAGLQPFPSGGGPKDGSKLQGGDLLIGGPNGASGGSGGMPPIGQEPPSAPQTPQVGAMDILQTLGDFMGQRQDYRQHQGALRQIHSMAGTRLGLPGSGATAALNPGGGAQLLQGGSGAVGAARNQMAQQMRNQLGPAPDKPNLLGMLGQLFSGGGAGGAAPAGAIGGGTAASLPFVGSFQTGTPFVPQTGLAKVHQGEAIIPANQNPAAGAAPLTPNAPQTQTQASAAPAAPQSIMQPNLYQQYIQNPIALSEPVQNQMLSRGLDSISMNAAGNARQIQNNSNLSGGQLRDALQQNQQMALGRGADFTRDLRTQAAIQNMNDLRQGVGMQLGAEQQYANQLMQQNAFQQGLYDQDLGYMGRIIDAISGYGQQAQGNQLGLFDRLFGQAQAGQGYGLQDLANAIGMQQWRLQPSPISAPPISVSGPGVPFATGGGGGGGSSAAYWPNAVGNGVMANTAPSFWN